jgi:rubrerythrin
MNFESFEDIIRFAIDKEKEAAAFYEDAAAQEPYAGAKKTFEGFAAEERKHETMLESFLKGERDVSDYRFEWVPDLKRSDYTVDLEYRKGMPYADLLRLAMKREEASLALYNEFIQKSDDNNIIKVFQMLAQEEAKHKLALETLYDDYMANMGD